MSLEINSSDIIKLAGAFGFGIDFADIGGQRGAFFLQPLDAVDKGFELIFGEAGFGHDGT